MRSKLLLTGTTGFLGSHLLKALIEDGNEIVALKRTHSDCKRIVSQLQNSHVTFYDIDDIRILEKIFAENDIYGVIHCAVEYGRGDALKITDTVETNINFSIRLLDMAIKNKCMFFTNVDSFFSKQLETGSMGKDNIYMPEYTLSKYQFSQWGQLKAVHSKIDFVNMRLEHIYGEDDDAEKFIPYIINSIKNKVPEIRLSEGLAERDFIYVEDVCNAFVMALHWVASNAGFGYKNIDIGRGFSVRVKDFVLEIKNSFSECETELLFGALNRSEQEIEKSCADIQEIQKMGWSPRYDVRFMIKNILT